MSWYKIAKIPFNQLGDSQLIMEAKSKAGAHIHDINNIIGRWRASLDNIQSGWEVKENQIEAKKYEKQLRIFVATGKLRVI